MRRVIPCQKCGSDACELELPVLDGIAAQLFRPVLRMAAARQGIELGDAIGNPLEALEPAAIAELLSIVCSNCVGRPSLQVARA